MAFPTYMNSQITDSVTEVNTLVLGDSPSMATGNMFIATSQALANTAHNATNQQNQGFITFQASTAQGSPDALRARHRLHRNRDRRDREARAALAEQFRGRD